MTVEEKDREIIRNIRTLVPNGIMEIKNAYFECNKDIAETFKLLKKWAQELRSI